MADTIVEFMAGSGQTLTLELFAIGEDTLANDTPGADTCSEAANRQRLYTATVTEDLADIHHAHIFDANGHPVEAGYVYLENDTNVHRVGSYVEALLEAAMSEVGTPAATPTPLNAIMTIYMALRNKLDITADLKEFHNNAGSVVWQKALTDTGTIYSEAEGAAP